LEKSINERSDRPLVTFALFTYNQEEYVREAVEAAFAQAYEPLEIILSDDCSTDSTFSVLKEMVAQYKGPHLVVAQQTTRNSGTFAHVLNVAKKARGELIVLASGDDVSKPDRTSQLVNAWKSTGAWGLYSRYDRIDKTGNLVSQAEWSTSLLAPDHTLRKYFYLHDGEVNIVHGATSAYDKRLFDYLTEDATQYILSEDGVLSLVLNVLNRRIVAIDQSLVLYRSHPGSLTNEGKQPFRQTIACIKSDIYKAVQYAKSCKERAQFILTFYKNNSKESLRRINIGEIDTSIYGFEMQATWTQKRFSERLRFIGDRKTKHMAKWMLPRLFGPTCFIFTKFVAKNTRYLAFRLAGTHD
jgi:glycosyltransferase involved in cell wall biosynthesis